MSTSVCVWGLIFFGCIFGNSRSQQGCEQIPTDNECREVLSDDYYVLRDLVLVPEFVRELQIIVDALQQSELCTKFLRILFCFYNFPSCDSSTSEALPVCLEKCPEIDSVLDECRSVVDLPTVQLLPGIAPYIENYNCTDPRTYYPDIPSDTRISNTSCTNITNLPLTMMDDNTTTVNATKGTSSRESSGGVIVGAIIGVLGLILGVVLVVGAVYLVRSKKKQRSSAIPHVPMSPFTLTPLTHSTTKEGNVLQQQFPRNIKDKEIKDFLQTVKGKFSNALIPADHITKQDLLGKGAFGVVFKGDLRLSDGSMVPVAIKTIALSNLNAIRDLVAESTVMKQFDHPNVLPLLGVCVDPDDDDVFKVVLPFMANGDLRSFLKCNRVEPNKIDEYNDNIDEHALLNMCLDIAKGMKYLSVKRFIHRDLAARNCMVDENHNIKVADFGLTKDIYTNEYYRADKHAALPVKWMALESLLDQYFDEKTDVWSYGVTCWEIFSLGRTPYPGVENKNVIDVVKDGERLCKPVLCPPKLFILMEATWSENPLKRPSFDEIVVELSQSLQE